MACLPLPLVGLLVSVRRNGGNWRAVLGGWRRLLLLCWAGAGVEAARRLESLEGNFPV